MDFVKLNRETYNKIAKLFHGTRQYLWDDILVFKKYLHDNIAVLDIGCGTGRLYQLLQEFQPFDSAQGRGIDYIGLDQSEGQIVMAKQDFPDNKYIVSEMTMLPLEDQKFDFVFCIATLHHLPDVESRKKALLEMKRVLKPGGHLFMTNWNMNSSTAQKTIAKGKWVKDEFGGHIVPWFSPEGEKVGERYYYGFDLEELKELLVGAGFELLENYYSKKGKETNKENGANIVTIAKKHFL